MSGKFSKYTHLAVRFDNDLLHIIASDYIATDIVFDPDDPNKISPHAINAIRGEVVALLTRECTKTVDLTRVPRLVNMMTISHTSKTGQLRRIRTFDHLDESMTQAIVPRCRSSFFIFAATVCISAQILMNWISP